MKVRLDFGAFSIFAGLDFFNFRVKEINYLPIFHNKIPNVEKTQNLFLVRNERYLNYLKDITNSKNKSFINSVSIFDKNKLNITDFDYDGNYEFEFINEENKEDYVNEDMKYLVKFLANRYLNMIYLFSPKRILSQHIPSVDIAICSYVCQLLGVEVIGIDHSTIMGEYSKIGPICVYEYMSDLVISTGRNSLENLQNRKISDEVNIFLSVTDVNSKINTKMDNFDKKKVAIFGNFYENNDKIFGKIVKDSLVLYEKFIENHPEIEFIYKPHPLNDILGNLKRFKNVKIVKTHKKIVESRPICALSVPSDVIFEYTFAGLPFITTSIGIIDFYKNAQDYISVAENIEEMEEAFQNILDYRDSYYDKMLDLYDTLYKDLPTLKDVIKEVINR